MTTSKKYKLVALGTDAAVASSVLGTYAVVHAQESGEGLGNGLNAAKTDEQASNFNNSISTVTNILLFIIGIASVIMLIVGGFQYIFSSGDSTKTATAKNTILYSIIGIVVALLAYAITAFIFGKFSATG